jgi:hypothetical protein
VLLPFWLALSASVALHIGVLLAPGWGLPFEDEPESQTLDATIAMPGPAVTKSVPVVPARKKRPPPRPSPPPTPAAPVAAVPEESPAESPAETEPAPSESSPVVAESAAVAVSPAPTFASQWPRTGRIVYQVTRGDDGFIIGQSEQSWSHDATTYKLRAVTETTGLAALFRPVKVVQESRGTFDEDGLRPLEFDTQREGKPQDLVRFDPAQGQIILARGGSIAFVPAVQDLLSMFYQLGALSLDVPQFKLSLVTGRKVGTYSASVVHAQKLDTPLGKRRVIHITVAASPSEDSTEIWLDEETRLPLKIRHRDRKGEVFVQVATVIELEKTE